MTEEPFAENLDFLTRAVALLCANTFQSQVWGEARQRLAPHDLWSSDNIMARLAPHDLWSSDNISSYSNKISALRWRSFTSISKYLREERNIDRML